MGDERPIHEHLTPAHAPNCSSKHKDDKKDQTTSRKSQDAETLIAEVSRWAVEDVVEWLKTRDLQKFAATVCSHHVTGMDLVNLKLGFVYDEEVSATDRENLLSEVYDLVSPCKSPVVQRRVSRYSTAEEREKYAAAVRVVRSRDRSSSPSLVVFSRSPSPGGPMQLSLPSNKSRSRSESGIDGILSTESTPLSSPARKYLKRKSTPNALLASKGMNRRPTLYSVFHALSPQCVQCVVVKQAENGHNFSCEISDQGSAMVKQMHGESELHVGDLLLEVNGISLIRGENSSSTELLLDRLLKSESLQLVIARAHSTACEDCSSTINNNDTDKCVSPDKWQKLREFLVELKSENIDPSELIKDTPSEHIQEIKENIALQEEVRQLHEALSDHVSKVSDLEKALEEKAGAVLEVERQKDVALQRLESVTLARSDKHESSSDGNKDNLGAGMYAELLDTLDLDSASKDEVLDALRETVKEATTQKTYLDKLMCIVLEEAPWLLDIIDPDLGDVSVESQGDAEEFC